MRSRDNLIRVIAFGRLSLFGRGAARLHDQLVSVAAQRTDLLTLALVFRGRPDSGWPTILQDVNSITDRLLRELT